MVNVAWQHPRHVYKDKIEELAYDACAHLKKPRTSDLLDRANANYVKVGRSRKKIKSYTTKPEPDRGYYDALRNEEMRIARDSKNRIVIRPNKKAEWTNWSRFICICAPIEIRGVDDLHKHANLTRRLLKRETTLEQEFSGCTYPQKNWIAEFQDSDVIGVLSHAVNV